MVKLKSYLLPSFRIEIEELRLKEIQAVWSTEAYSFPYITVPRINAQVTWTSIRPFLIMDNIETC